MTAIANASKMVPAIAPTNRGKQRIVVVLGMHRSGTSLLTNLLSILGVELGQNLLAGNASNEMGHWENESIYRAHDALLNYIAKDWGECGFAYPFAIDWERLPEFRPFQEELRSIVRAELAKARGIWGFKDPRACRLLPLWKSIFSELDLEPLYVLAIRNPADVADSLLKRNQFDLLHSELLWLLHTLEAVRDAGADLRVIVDYDRWFTAPRAQARAVAQALDLPWPTSECALLARLTETIRPDLRHHKKRRSCCLPFAAKNVRHFESAAATGKGLDSISVGELRLSYECLGAALELSAGAGKIVLAVGHAEASAGNAEAALAAFTRATLLQPRLAAAHSSRALALHSLGRWAEALQSARQALSLDPSNAVALKVLARSQIQGGQLAAAEQTCRLILGRDAADVDALRMIEEMRRHKEKAKQAAESLFGPGAKRVPPPPIVPAPVFVRKNRPAIPAAAEPRSPPRVIPVVAWRRTRT